jgi:hypothetical protein
VKLFLLEFDVKTIYTNLLDDFLGRLTGLADDDEETLKYRPLNRNCRQAVKEVIKERILPEFQSFTPLMQEASKLCLKYYLSKPGFRFDRVYESLLLPFDHPDDARDFFVWIWEVLFDGEDYHTEHLNQNNRCQFCFP